MRWLLAASVAILLGGCSEPKSDAPIFAGSVAEPVDSTAHARSLKRVTTGMPGGSEERAREDAEQAAKEDVFGLIGTGDARFSSLPAGAICFTPGGQAPLTLTSYGHGDYITAEVSAHVRYAAAYNRALVERPDYPYRDLCRARTDADNEIRIDEPKLITKPARAVSAPPRDLFEAARRGSSRDLSRHLDSSSVNVSDSVGMTALAWAVARDNRAAIDLLLSAGANPWLAGRTRMHGETEGAAFWAAALGRGDLFARLAELPGRPFESWSPTYLSAALAGGDPAILKHMLAERHEDIRLEYLRSPLPSAAMFELALKRHPDLAQPLLFEAMGHPGDRPDLVRLALARGANPNAVKDYESPLAKAAKGLESRSVEIVDLLLKAGADPNMPSHRTRPVWEAVRMLTLDGKVDEFDRRATAIFHRLVAAGADLKQPNWQGLPPIWFLLFPYSYDHGTLDASFITPPLLEMLVQNGMDVNAEWNGRRVLGPVEAQAGRDSELAQTLRRLGARP
jgi:ankyrin repeat protein